MFSRKLLFLFLLISQILPIANLKSEYKNHHLDNKLIALDEKVVNKNQYILGAGDILSIRFEDFEEYNSYVKIKIDGNLDLPMIGDVVAEDLIIEEINSLALERYSKIMNNPIIEIKLVKQRPIKVFLSGEITRPGLYKLTKDDEDAVKYLGSVNSDEFEIIEDFSIDNAPTLYEGIRTAQGITSVTDLENIEFRRKIPKKYGGGYKKTNLNLLSIFIYGDDSDNIKLMDGDVIIFKKSNKKIPEQILNVSKSNLNPATIGVYVTGRVQKPGLKNLLPGSTLNEAIAVAGGPKVLRGKVELITSKNDKLLIRTVKYNPKSTSSKKNPILKSGDIVRVRNSVISAGTELFSEIVPPIIGINTIYEILE